MSEPDSPTQGIARILRERRTVHDFTDATPPTDTIVQAIELARWAPNHLRTEPWHFYVLDRTVGRRVAALNAELVRESKSAKVADVKLRRWSEMPGWLVVTCARSDDEIRMREDYAACCCAIHNIALYLWEQGLGMKWTTGAVTRDPRFFDLVGMDFDAVYVVGLFWYGYPADVPVQHRRPVASIMSYVNGDSDGR